MATERNTYNDNDDLASAKELMDPNYKRTLAKSGNSYYFTEVPIGTDRLPPGSYYMTSIRTPNGVVPGYEPLEVTNDPPLEIDGTLKTISDEMMKFLGRREQFARFKFAHKRGYLFYGPPGCGKSSFLRLLEDRFVERFEGIVLFWEGSGNPKFWYDDVRAKHPTTPIMLVTEDIDTRFRDFEENVLEFLDGQQGLDNFVLVCTTNNLFSIPERLRNRPSRIDRVIGIGAPDLKARADYLLKVGMNQDEAERLAAATPKLSLAQLKEVVIGHICLEQPLPSVIERLNKMHSGGD